MLDGALDLFKAIRSALMADAELSGQVGQRIFTDWSNDADTPFIRLHSPSSLNFEADDGETGAEGSEVSINVHVFAAENGPVVCRRIADRVRRVLRNEASLVLDSTDLWSLIFIDTINRGQDPENPKLQTAIVRFRAVTTDAD